MKKNKPKKYHLKTLVATALVPLVLVLGTTSLATTARASDFIDYLSGCVMSLGANIAGTAFVNARLPQNAQINSTGYGVSAAVGCLAGVAYVGIVGSQAEFSATWRLKQDKENLTFQLRRLSKERCLLKETCEPGGQAIIVDEAPELRKQGDKVFETHTQTIMPND